MRELVLTILLIVCFSVVSEMSYQDELAQEQARYGDIKRGAK